MTSPCSTCTHTHTQVQSSFRIMTCLGHNISASMTAMLNGTSSYVPIPSNGLPREFRGDESTSCRRIASVAQAMLPLSWFSSSTARRSPAAIQYTDPHEPGVNEIHRVMNVGEKKIYHLYFQEQRRTDLKREAASDRELSLQYVGA